MICPKCGAQVSENAKFCHRCGNGFITNQVNTNTSPNNTGEVPHYEPKPTQSYPPPAPPQSYPPPYQGGQGAYQPPQQNHYPPYQTPSGYQQYQQPYYAQGTAYQPAPQPKKSNRKVLLAIIAVLVVLCIVVGILIPLVAHKGTAVRGEKKEYTLMLYLCGSNLESESRAATRDLQEIMKNDIDTNKVNVLIYTGGTEMWYSNISSSRNSTILLKDTDFGLQMDTVKTESARSMGDASTFGDFLSYAEYNYPADHYGLICWDHGSGPLLGFGVDELFYNDTLTLGEMKAGLQASPFKDGNKLDWVGFDACLMSSIEIANVLKDHADYMVASQETEPGYGWDYSFLNKLNETYDAKEICTAAVNAFSDYYDSHSGFALNPDVTLSCLDLSKTDGVVSAMGDLFGDMNAALQQGEYITLARERSDYHSFGDAAYSERGWSYDLVDLDDFSAQAEGRFGDKARALRAAVSDMVVCNESNLYYANGVSVYYPYNGENLFANYGYDYYQEIATSESHLQYIKNFTDKWLGDTLQETANGYRVNPEIGSLAKASEGGEKITLQLTDEQLASYSQATYTIFVKSMFDSDEYIPIMQNCKVEPNGKGVISVSKEQNIAVITDGNDSSYYPMVEISSDGDIKNYQSYQSAVYSTIEYYPAGAREGVLVQTRAEQGSDEMTIKSIDIPAENIQNGARNELDYEKWPLFGFIYASGKAKYGDDGKLLPYTEWDMQDLSGVSVIHLNEDMKIKNVKTTDNLVESLNIGEDFYIQIVVTDVYGKKYASDLTEIKNASRQDDYTQKTTNGELHYEMYSDGAVLTNYKGSDKKLTIPKTVNGVPVKAIQTEAFNVYKDGYKNRQYEHMDEITIESPDTVLGFHAFMGADIAKINLPDGLKEIPESSLSNSQFQEINLPDSVEVIGDHAFAYCKQLKKLTLPAGVKSIGNGAFALCYFADGLTFKGENAAYNLKDGVLTTKDGKTLVAYTYTGSNSYTVPDGVEEIAPYAFSLSAYVSDGKTTVDTTLHEVTIAGSVKKIGDFAFYGNSQLTKLDIPDSVEQIGHNAFYIDVILTKDSKTLEEVKIGKGLSWMGQQAFSGWNVAKFTVSEDNETYSAKDGKLMNKAGESEISIQFLTDGANYVDELDNTTAPTEEAAT